MRKLLTRVGLAAGTLGLVFAGAAAFSAFEAHVVNVTATITNATNVDTTALTFGNMFPEEVRDQFVSLSLSDSFLNSSNTLASIVDYHIRQKPKCFNSETQAYEAVVDVFGNGTSSPATAFACPDAGFTMLPLLCPFLSKHPDGTPANDESLNAFHGPTSTPEWTPAVAESLQVNGELNKNTDPSDKWDIDMHTPCFKGQCAQDNVVPTAYQLDQDLQGKQLGCDLWFEVSGINNGPQGPQE